eukprot:2449451-Prymnesium_polylepis.1
MRRGTRAWRSLEDTNDENVCPGLPPILIVDLAACTLLPGQQECEHESVRGRGDRRQERLPQANDCATEAVGLARFAVDHIAHCGARGRLGNPLKPLREFLDRAIELDPVATRDRHRLLHGRHEHAPCEIEARRGPRQAPCTEHGWATPTCV